MTVSADQQAMWDAMTTLGQDTDGDKTPAAVIAGMGEDGFRNHFIDFISDVRREHDEAIDEVCMNPAAHGPLEELTEPEGGPNDGHTFEFTMRSRGSYGITGEEDHHDSEWMPDPLWAIRIRAWSLTEALQRLAGVPMVEWTRHLKEYDNE